MTISDKTQEAFFFFFFFATSIMIEHLTQIMYSERGNVVVYCLHYTNFIATSLFFVSLDLHDYHDYVT